MRPHVLAAVLCITPIAANAQDTPPPTGTVEGTVLFGDTHRPARLTKVILTPANANNNDTTLKNLGEAGAKNDPGAALGALMGSVSMLMAQTDMDGHYQLSGIPPGDYYVLANVSGYLSPAAAAMLTGGIANATVAGTPIHVEPNRSTTANESLDRGATISGTVTYDDGTPAPDLTVTIESWQTSEIKPDPTKIDFGQIMTMAMAGGIKVGTTNDRGQYRISGLPAGDYRVHLALPVGTALRMRNGVMDVNSMKGATPIALYAPAAIHAKDAVKISVKTAEEKSGVAFNINLSGLRTVSGHITSAADHHPINSGSVSLTDTADKAFKRSGTIAPDGSFAVAYLPPGTYTLSVTGAADTEAAPKPQKATGLLNFQRDKTIRSYTTLTQPQSIGSSNVESLNLELQEAPPKPVRPAAPPRPTDD